MVRQIDINSPYYPPMLKNIFDPPKQLYINGILPKGKYAAVVGTRQISKKGEEITTKIVINLVKGGFIIISGMALGVDSMAHKTALRNGGKTVAVLGAGIDIIYPTAHKDLYNSIVKNGAVISEHPPGKIVPRNVFAARNRIISGLSEFVVITEASIKSGSMITAKLALDQGKDVYCVPGSEGCDFLISQGARLI
ncbi:DNA-protecting protein DprA [Candidatus Microgenomates bacterium]|nr:DNA-protecting protein DprA [Candidatus Microgenomates bacterium]